MNRIAIVSAVLLAGAGAASANLIQNGDFSQGSTAWNWSSQWGGTYFYNDGTDDILSRGWWNGLGVWQDTGAKYQANSIYTFTVVARTGDNGRGVTFNLQDTTAGWTTVGTDHTFKFAETSKGLKPGPWETFSFDLDTRTTPGVIGHNIGVGVAEYMDTEWNANGWGWVHFNTVDLEVRAVPEPATMFALGLGLVGIVARRRRK